MSFKLPPNTPAQVRSWVIDFEVAKKKGDTVEQGILSGKIHKYLAAVKLNKGVAIKPPVTSAEREVAEYRRKIALIGSDLQYRANY